MGYYRLNRGGEKTVTEVLEISQTIEAVVEAAERIKNDEMQFFPEAAVVGDAVRQGDIYIQKVSDSVIDELPDIFTRIPSVPGPFQLAPGNTKGSRHYLEVSADTEIYQLKSRDIGKELVAKSDWKVRGTASDKVVKTILAAPEARKSFDAYKVRLEATPVTGGFDSMIEQHYAMADMLKSIGRALEFSGPVFRLNAAAVVSHPEHGDWLLPSGVYRIVFQRTVTAADATSRVVD